MKYINFIKYLILKLMESDGFIFAVFLSVLGGIAYVGMTWPVLFLVTVLSILAVLCVVKFIFFIVESWDEYEDKIEREEINARDK